ncbi:hypothetical protein HDU76_014045, partial [Blyttiomyces sp. JEL0837]
MNHQSTKSLGLQTLLILLEDSDLLYHLPTPNSFSTLTAVCRRLRLLSQTHLDLWLRSRFIDLLYEDILIRIDAFINHFKIEPHQLPYPYLSFIKTPYTKINSTAEDLWFANNLIQKCIIVGRADVLWSLISNIPITYSIRGGPMLHHMKTVVTISGITPEDRRNLLMVLMELNAEYELYVENL